LQDSEQKSWDETPKLYCDKCFGHSLDGEIADAWWRARVASQSDPQVQYWAGRTLPPNNAPPNMAAANFVLITNFGLMDAGMSNW